MSEIGKNEDPVRFVSDMFGLALNFSVEVDAVVELS